MTKLTITQKLVKVKRQYLIANIINVLKAHSFAARIKQANLASKNNISDLAKRKQKDILDKKTEKLAIKAELKAEQDKIEKLQTYDLSLFIDQSYFIINGSKSFLIFQSIFNTFTTQLVLQTQL